MTSNVKFNYSATTKRVTDREVAVARLGADYANLVAHFGLTAESESDVITDAARTVVIDGARQSGTKVGDALTVDDLTGRNPGADAVTLPYWKAARAVRIGLVKAIETTEDDSPKPVVLRASLSGEGGGSVTIPTDHPLYASIVEMIAGQNEK